MCRGGGALRPLVVDGLAQTPQYDAALVEALAAEGCNVRLWAAERPEEAGAFGRLGGRLYEPKWLRRINRVFRSGAPRRVARGVAYFFDLQSIPGLAQHHDVVHVQWLCLIPVTKREVRLLARVRNGLKPVVYTAHNPLPHEGASKAVIDTMSELYAVADAVLVHSRVLRDQVLELFALDPSKVHVVPMGPMHVQSDSTRPREEKTLRTDAPLLLQFGVIRPYKGVEVLLRAMPIVRSRFPQARLLVVGRPLGGVARELVGLSKDLGLQDCCTFRFEFVPDVELEALMDQAAIAVFPYLHASQSAAVLSAMARSCPVVATAVGGIPEVIRDGVDGYLVPPGDPQALAERLIHALQDPAREHIGRAGRERLLRDFSWSAAARKTAEVYRTVIARMQRRLG